MLNYNCRYSEGGKFNEVKYYQWLLDKVGADREPHMDYLLLLQTLHRIDYVWRLPMDSNRAQDGLMLRATYMMEQGYIPNIITEDGDVPPASVLEVLIALSYRCENDIIGENHPDRWFWIAIQNMDLMKCSDDHFNSDYVRQQIDIWLEGRYRKNGQGGPFPLRWPQGDQRNKELWVQMEAFINENYQAILAL